MKMTKILLLDLFVIFCSFLPFANSGFAVLTNEMLERPMDFDCIMGVDFKGNQVKLPGSVPTAGVLNITAENMGANDPSQKEKVAEAERQEMLDLLLNHPRALLYTEVNFTGLEEKYEYRDRPTEMDFRGSCINTEHLGFTGMFPGPFIDGWKSVKTFGSCVRLFRQFDCHWDSIAVYPGVSGKHVYLEHEGEIFYPRSVGPCLEHEFKFSSISKVNGELTVKKDKSNYLQIPDQIFVSHMSSTQLAIQIPSSTPTTVQALILDIGLKHNRTKVISVDFSLPGLLYFESYPGEEIVPEKEGKWKPFLQDKREGDDLGYLIPPKIGGPIDEMYNIFPQGRDNYVKWTAVTDIIFESFKAQRGHSPAIHRQFMYINLYYENEEATRPFGLYYYLSMLMSYEGNRIDYGFLYN